MRVIGVVALLCSTVVFAGPATITLTPAQVDSIIAQQGGVPGPVPPIVTPPVPPVVTPPGAISCIGFAATRVIDLNWAAPVRVFTRDYGGFAATDAVVVRFTTGNTSSTNNLPHITAVEFQDPPSSRTAVLSATPCDFSRSPGAMSVGNTVDTKFALGTGTGFGYYPVLKLNTTYYLNMQNSPGSGCSGSCNMSIDIIKGAL